MKHETRRRLRARYEMRAKTHDAQITQLGDMPPSTHSKNLKRKRKQSRRKGHG